MLVEDPDGPVLLTSEEDKIWLEAGKEPGELQLIRLDRVSMIAWDARNTCEPVIELTEPYCSWFLRHLIRVSVLSIEYHPGSQRFL
jgi:hypothetical protein